MTRLEDLQPTAAVRGILPEQAVGVVSVQWFGSEALEAETGLTFGLGPTFVFPTATSKFAGQGAWQAGPACAAVYTGVPRLLIFGGLIGACISALSDRHVEGVKTSLVIAAVLRPGLGHRPSDVHRRRDPNQSATSSD